MQKALDFLQKLFNIVDKINPKIKSIIIIILFIWSTQYYVSHQGREYIKAYIESVDYENKKAEEYSIKVTPEIRRNIEQIKDKDTSATNIILLSFHNTKKSINGFSYMYLTAIAESPKLVNIDESLSLWKELSYVQYEEEVSKIRREGMLKIDNVENIKYQFPRFYKKLHQCDIKHAIIYPIESIGTDDENIPIGLIIISYDKPKKYDSDYYLHTISPPIQRLSTLLNYDLMKYKNKM